MDDPHYTATIFPPILFLTDTGPDPNVCSACDQPATVTVVFTPPETRNPRQYRNHIALCVQHVEELRRLMR